MVTEFLPTKLRGPGLVLQGTLWTVGYVGAACIGYWLIGFGGDIWRPMLASSAIIALLVVLLRIGMPETPRWLVMHGQPAKAKMIVEKYFGPNVTIDNLQEEATRLHKQNHNNKVSYSMLFKNGMWKRTVFCGFSWLSTTIPLFGIFTFVPTILATLHVSDPHLGTLLINFTMLAGAIISTFIIDKFSRRGLAISTLIVTALPLLASRYLAYHGRRPCCRYVLRLYFIWSNFW